MNHGSELYEPERAAPPRKPNNHSFALIIAIWPLLVTIGMGGLNYCSADLLELRLPMLLQVVAEFSCDVFA